MMDDREILIRPEERKILRELAKKQAEYAALPENREKERLWYLHNALAGERPMIVMEEMSFEQEILPACRCVSPLARHMEQLMNEQIVNHELVKDDKVTASTLDITLEISRRLFDMDFHMIRPKEKSDTFQGFQYEHPITDLEEDFDKLKPSTYSCDREWNRRRLEVAEEVVGDILPVRLKNRSLEWIGAITYTTVLLMGLEDYLINLAAEPELTEKLLDFITTDIENYVDWLEQESLLTPNNGNDYAGAGSYGFTYELRPEQGKVCAKDLWFNMNSQESSSISPEMYGAQVFPFFKRLAEKFGLIYYGCCEPIHSVWEKYVSTIPHLRKVSISAWCDEDYMGEALRGGQVIYSRKPSPLFIGTADPLDEDAFRAYVGKTLKAARDCHIEFIFRDVYTLGGDLSKPSRAVGIIREMIG